MDEIADLQSNKQIYILGEGMSFFRNLSVPSSPLSIHVHACNLPQNPYCMERSTGDCALTAPRPAPTPPDSVLIRAKPVRHHHRNWLIVMGDCSSI